MTQTPSRPPLKGTLAFILLLSLLILLIQRGLFDPHPIGPLQWQKALTTTTISPQAHQLTWLPPAAAYTTADRYSLRLTAAYASGETDSLYGLIIGDDAFYTAVALSPAGYVTIWQGDTTLLPLQTWPHIHTHTTPNEIWLDVTEEQLTVRINQERLWQGEVAVQGQIGLIGVSFGQTAVIDFQTIQLFAPPSPTR